MAKMMEAGIEATGLPSLSINQQKNNKTGDTMAKTITRLIKKVPKTYCVVDNHTFVALYICDILRELEDTDGYRIGLKIRNNEIKDFLIAEGIIGDTNNRGCYCKNEKKRKNLLERIGKTCFPEEWPF